MNLKKFVAAVAIVACGSVFADTITVNEGATVTTNGLSETSRLTKAGAGTLVLSGNNSLATMTVSAGTLNVHGATTIQLGPRTQVGFASSWSAATQVSQTVARVEGVGSVAYCEKLAVTNGISPIFDGSYGTLTFGRACSISGDYEIVGDANGCGCVKFNQKQNVSNLKLKIAAGATLDASKVSTYYKIVDAPNGITGEFDKSGLPENWDVKYAADGKSVYVFYQKGAIVILK